jgi:N-acetylglucosaminyl-diphospho-decaprenol L-rhamnosyltransferase
MLSAVVVHFRGHGRIRQCVRSCLDDPDVGEVIVVDNEGTRSRLREELAGLPVRLIAMARNVGYGRAANVGLGLAPAGAVLLLNQDTVLCPRAVAGMLDASSKGKAWVVGPLLLGRDGLPAQPKDRFPSPLSWQPPADGGEDWRYVPWVAGAAMLFMPGHTDLRFDERLFMYAEDEELCWRVWAAGGRVVLASNARVIHEGGTATRRQWGRTSITLRTVANRARMVRWHTGAAGLLSFARHSSGATLRSIARLGLPSKC